MKEFLRIVLPLLILLGGIGGFVLLGARRTPEGRSEQTETVPPVETMPVKVHTGGLDIEVDGLVVPYRDVELAAEVAGRIIKKAEACRAGKYVRKGQLLIEIDPRDYDLETRRLSKELEQADVTLKELDVEAANTEALVELAEERLKLEQKEMARLEKLSGNRFVTDSHLDQERQNLIAVRNALVTLRNQLSLLSMRRNRFESAQEFIGVRLEKAQLDRSRASIASPIDGVVIRDMVEPDTYVNRGTSLVVIEDTSDVEVKCSLRMDEMYWIWRQPMAESKAADEATVARGYRFPKTPVTVVYELAGQRYAWDGFLTRYDGIGLDEKTRTVPCRVVVDNPRSARVLGPGSKPDTWSGPPALVRGMYVNVIIHAKPRLALLEIPEKALQPGSRVWQVEGGHLKICQVHVVEVEDGTVLVNADASSLKAGDRVVASPLADVRDGMAIQESPGK